MNNLQNSKKNKNVGNVRCWQLVEKDLQCCKQQQPNRRQLDSLIWNRTDEQYDLVKQRQRRQERLLLENRVQDERYQNPRRHLARKTAIPIDRKR